MPTPSRVEPPAIPGSPAGPDDDFLASSVLGGDESALRKLMDRYDRLVRYAVFRMSRSRCLRDPHWLDTVASDTWTGFVRSLQRNPDDRPKSLQAYLVRIARNQCVSAMRGSVQLPNPHQDISAGEIAATTEEPSELLSELELLDALRGCLAKLDSDGQKMAAQLTTITERRWKDAASTLGISESTLRSRWKKILDQLRRCLTAKTGKSIAPQDETSDFLGGR